MRYARYVRFQFLICVLAAALSVLPQCAATLHAATPPLPPKKCPAARTTKHTNHILRPRQFRTAIAGYNKLRPNLTGIVLTSAWQTVTRGSYETIFAGAVRSGKFAHHGMIEIVTNGTCQLGPVEAASTTNRTGPLTLTSIKGSSVKFAYSGGNGVLDLRTLRFTIYAVK